MKNMHIRAVGGGGGGATGSVHDGRIWRFKSQTQRTYEPEILHSKNTWLQFPTQKIAFFSGTHMLLKKKFK